MDIILSLVRNVYNPLMMREFLFGAGLIIFPLNQRNVENYLAPFLFSSRSLTPSIYLNPRLFDNLHLYDSIILTDFRSRKLPILSLLFLVFSESNMQKKF